MGLGKKHRVELDIKKYMHLIIGDKKIGKTGLTADMAKEIYGDIGKLLIVSIGKEKAYEAIDGVLYEEPQSWEEIMEIVDKLVANIDDYDFDMVSFDTIDEIIPMVEQEVIRLHTVAYKEVPKGFNACFGGYNAQKDKAREVIDELLSKLDKIKHKTGVYFIGHNKVRPIKTKLDSEDYYVVSSNLPFDYFNMFAYKCPIICNIIKEVETLDTGKEEGVGKNKKDILVAEKRDRFMYFRDSGAVEAGGRFKHMPEKVSYGATNYHDAVIEGIKASINRKDEAEEGSKKLETKANPLNEVLKEDSKEEKTMKSKKTVKEVIKEVIDTAKEVQDGGIQQKDIMDILKSEGYPNPNDIPTVEIGEKIIIKLNSLLG